LPAHPQPNPQPHPQPPPADRLAELVSAAAYGTVLVLGALATVGVWEIDLGYGLELVGGVGVATWIAHLFAEVLAGHLRERRPLGRREMVRALGDGSPILGATVLPAGALLLGQLDVISNSTARAAAVLVAVTQMLALGLLVGRVAPARPQGAWMFAVATAGIGVAVVALTVRLGH
jgi:hypothetical protein